MLSTHLAQVLNSDDNEGSGFVMQRNFLIMDKIRRSVKDRWILISAY